MDKSLWLLLALSGALIVLFAPHTTLTVSIIALLSAIATRGGLGAIAIHDSSIPAAAPTGRRLAAGLLGHGGLRNRPFQHSPDP